MAEENKVNVEITGENAGLKAAITESIEQIKAIPEAINAVTEAFSGIAEAWAAAFAVDKIKEWVDEVAEAGEKLQNLSMILGVSAEQMAQFSTLGQVAGLSQDELGSAVEKLERNLSKAAGGDKQLVAAFKAVGLQGEQLKAALENPAEAIETLGTKIAGFADGPNKVALSMELLGRSGATLIPMFDDMNKLQEQYGSSLKDLSEQQATFSEGEKNTSEQLNFLKVAISTTSQAIFTTFKPVIDASIQSMTQWVLWLDNAITKDASFRDSLNDTVNGINFFISVIENTVDILFTLGEVIGELIATGLVDLALNIELVYYQFKVLGDVIETVFTQLGNGLADLASGKFSAAAQAVAGMQDAIVANAAKDVAQINAINQGMANYTAATFQDMGNKISDSFTRVEQRAQEAANKINSNFQNLGNINPEQEEKKELPQAPVIPAQQQEKSRVEQWRQEREQQVEEAKEFNKDLLADDEAYWQSKLALATKGSKEYNQVYHLIYDDEKQLAHESLEIENDKATTAISMAKMELDAKKGYLDDEVAAGQITNNQKFKLLEDYTNQEYQLDLQELERKKQLYAQQPVELQKVLDEEKKLQTQHSIDMEKINKDMLNQQHKDFDEVYKDITSSFNSSIEGMLKGTTTFTQAVGNLLDKLFDKFLGMVEDWVEKWLWKEISQTAATSTQTAARTAIQNTSDTGFLSSIGDQIAQWLGLETAKTTAATTSAATTSATNFASAQSGAALAAVNAMSSVAAIPYVGWAMAPEVGATTLAQGEVYASMAALETGAWEIPTTMPALLHPGETVLPRPFAEDYRNNIGAGSGNTGSGGVQNVTINSNVTHNSPFGPSDVMGAISQNTNDLAKILSGMARKGMLR